MNKRHYEHTLPNIRGSLSNTYCPIIVGCLLNNWFLFSRLYTVSLFRRVKQQPVSGFQRDLDRAHLLGDVL